MERRAYEKVQVDPAAQVVDPVYYIQAVNLNPTTQEERGTYTDATALSILSYNARTRRFSRRHSSSSRGGSGSS